MGPLPETNPSVSSNKADPIPEGPRAVGPSAPGAGISRAAGSLRSAVSITAVEGLAVWALLILGSVTAAGTGPVAISPLKIFAGCLTLALTVAVAWATWKAHTDQGWLERAAARTSRLASRESRLRLSVGVFYLSVLLAVAALLGVSLRMNPGLVSLWADFARRGFPVLLWICLITFQAACLLHALSVRSVAHAVTSFAVGGAILVLLLIYWYGAEGQLLYFNTEMGKTNQSAYMEYAQELRASGYAYPGDFNRMPVYPFLISLLLRPGMTDPAFFFAAKYFSLFLSVILLAALAVIFFRLDGPWNALNLTLIVAFSVFVYKAPWVQAELLFYFLNTCLFLLLWRLLQRPDARTAFAAGVVAAVAHLTKASVLPALAVFGVFAVVRGVERWASDRRHTPLAATDGSSKARIGTALWPLLTAAVFLAVLTPYLLVSHRMSGHFFYNVNSTFYIWYDSWEEAIVGTKAHGDRLGWPDMPASEIPSMAKYVREHTPAQAWERLVAGGQEIMEGVLASHGYFTYVVLYGGLLIVAAGIKWRRAGRLISENLLVLLFFVAYFTVYLLLYFWYAPIVAGDRMILAIFIPLLIVLSHGLNVLLRGEAVRIRRRTIPCMTMLNVMILGVVAANAWWALAKGVYVLGGGG